MKRDSHAETRRRRGEGLTTKFTKHTKGNREEGDRVRRAGGASIQESGFRMDVRIDANKPKKPGERNEVSINVNK